jgi:hypothetical protein
LHGHLQTAASLGIGRQGGWGQRQAAGRSSLSAGPPEKRLAPALSSITEAKAPAASRLGRVPLQQWGVGGTGRDGISRSMAWRPSVHRLTLLGRQRHAQRGMRAQQGDASHFSWLLLMSSSTRVGSDPR